VQIPKDKILKIPRQHGDPDKADQAEHELPDQVDLDLLQRSGLNPRELLSKLGGDIPGL
jgi:hypothetical protein